MKNFALIVLFLFCFSSKAQQQQISNYVANGSFEEYYKCIAPPLVTTTYVVKNWGSPCPDSLLPAPIYRSYCLNNVPYFGASHEYPHSGEAFLLTLFYDAGTIPYKRMYAKNRLKATLQAGKTYCVKFYINYLNSTIYGIDGFGAYFCGSEIDTISYCTIPLTYLIPQIQNPQGNIITDISNWIPITGTFTANGTEKYMVIGNFLSNEDTDKLMINSPNPEIYATEANIDDVSCIPIDLEAYAGRDTTILYGDSVYIGREKDFATDPYCVWYKLPDTANAIDTTSGLWVKPSVTTTYVVKQELECSPLKWDTVVVNVGYVGLNEYVMSNMQVEVYPNPANDLVKIESNIPNEELNISIVDVTGRTVMNKKLEIKNHTADIELNLSNGVYILKITNNQQKTISKKLVIAR
ncbi:MAG: T9SS type A sorting domain-containing protein [Bacteroidetes bacterium]|nr:T9SS type A sorting domain-containing protein [Bacteroidota bacterium]